MVTNINTKSAEKTVGQRKPNRMTTDKTSKPGFVHRYPIVSFCILAFVLGAGIMFFVIWRELPSELALISVLSSSIAGIFITAVVDGSAGLKLMLNRLLIYRVGVGYWFVAFLFPLPVILLGSLFNPLFNGDPISFINIKPAFGIVPMFISFFIIAGLGQELGWSGFLLPRLQSHFSALTASIIRAVIGCIWHLPIFIFSLLQPQALAGFQYAGWIAQKGFLAAVMTATFMFLIPWAISFSWMFNNTKGSLLLVSILHGSEIWVAYWMLSAGIKPNNLDNYWGYGVIMILVAIIIVIITGPLNLSRKQQRIIHQP